jgi:hypothetical protein
MFRKLFVAALLIALGSATPVAAKDPWKHYYKEQEKHYKEQEKRAKAYDKYWRKQTKEAYKFCRKNGC